LKDALEEIIKKNVHFNVIDLKIDNVEDETIIDRIEQLRPKMMLRIGFTAEISRNRTVTVTMKVKTDAEMSLSRLGLPDLNSPKVPIENATQYMPDAIGFTSEITQALNQALKQNQPTKVDNQKTVMDGKNRL
jgi:hypothetical protein